MISRTLTIKISDVSYAMEKYGVSIVKPAILSNCDEF